MPLPHMFVVDGLYVTWWNDRKKFFFYSKTSFRDHRRWPTLNAMLAKPMPSMEHHCAPQRQPQCHAMTDMTRVWPDSTSEKGIKTKTHPTSLSRRWRHTTCKTLVLTWFPFVAYCYVSLTIISINICKSEPPSNSKMHIKLRQTGYLIPNDVTIVRLLTYVA